MNAIMELLKKKDVRQVTVSEICRIVHINRSTFYEDFLDVYDLLEKIALSISSELANMPPNGKPTKDDFLFLFCHIRRHKDFYELYFKQGLPMSVQNRILPNEPPFKPDDVAELRRIFSDVQLEYHHAFFRAGLNAMIENWLKRDCAETPDELYEMLQNEYMAMGHYGLE